MTMKEVLREAGLKLAEEQFDLLLKEAGVTDEEIKLFTLKDKCVGVAVISHILETHDLKNIAMELYKTL